MRYSVLKRIIDAACALAALILLAPVLLVTALAIRLRMGSPVLFRQTRPGYRGRPFDVVKFRTMLIGFGPDGKPLPDSQRLTAFGRFLRRTSLDELPQLVNVLKGDMSLVGPRPLLMEYMPYYTPREQTRHNVRPGVTGLAQVSGRNRLTWEEKLELDARYVEQCSCLLDLKIVGLTIKRVLSRSDVLEAAPQGPLSAYRQKLQQGGAP